MPKSRIVVDDEVATRAPKLTISSPHNYFLSERTNPPYTKVVNEEPTIITPKPYRYNILYNNGERNGGFIKYDDTSASREYYSATFKYLIPTLSYEPLEIRKPKGFFRKSSGIDSTLNFKKGAKNLNFKMEGIGKKPRQSLKVSSKKIDKISISGSDGNEEFVFVGPRNKPIRKINNLSARFFEGQEDEIIVYAKNIDDVVINSGRTKEKIKAMKTTMFYKTKVGSFRFTANDDSHRLMAAGVRADTMTLKLAGGSATIGPSKSIKISSDVNQYISIQVPYNGYKQMISSIDVSGMVAPHDPLTEGKRNFISVEFYGSPKDFRAFRDEENGLMKGSGYSEWLDKLGIGWVSDGRGTTRSQWNGTTIGRWIDDPGIDPLEIGKDVVW